MIKNLYRLCSKHSIEPEIYPEDSYLLSYKNINNLELRDIKKSLKKEDLKLNKVKDLTPGDYLCLEIPKDNNYNKTLSEDDAFVYGLMLGDGYITNDHKREAGISLNIKNNLKDLAFMENYLKAKGVNYWISRTETVNKIRWTHKRTSIPISRGDLYDSQNNKRISINNLPEPQTLKLIKGLIKTDGGIYKGRISFYNGNRYLIEGLKYQLLRLGIPSSGQKQIKKAHTAQEKSGRKLFFKTSICYTLNIPAVQKLAKELEVKPTSRIFWVRKDDFILTKISNLDKIDSVLDSNNYYSESI